MGRPKNFTDKQIKKLVEQFNEYINTTDIPIIAEFAYTHDINRQTLYDYDEFSTLIKKCIDKKEAELEKRALKGEVNHTMAIFSLKQLGWKDKQEIEHSGETTHNVNSNDLSKYSVEELKQLEQILSKNTESN